MYDDTDEVVRVIDTSAETDDDLQDSYVGKVIINCNVCHSHVFESKEDIKIEEDGAVNVDMQCPYCGEEEGFTIVGEIRPYGEDTTEETEQPEEIEEGLGGAIAGGILGGGVGHPIVGAMTGSYIQDKLNEEETDERQSNKSLKMSRATKRNMTEDFKEVSITTDDQHMEMTSDENGKVTVTTEPVTSEETNEPTEDMIALVSAETEEEILNNNGVEAEPAEEDTVEDDFDFDFEEVDEEGIDELGESYLRKVYENVKSFKTSSVAANDQALIVEGVITFNSGAKKKTGFVFEAKDANVKGQVRFSGSNKQLAESTDAFSLVGRVDNKKLFVESLKYNYKVNEEFVRGLVRRK